MQRKSGFKGVTVRWETNSQVTEFVCRVSKLHRVKTVLMKIKTSSEKRRETHIELSLCSLSTSESYATPRLTPMIESLIDNNSD